MKHILTLAISLIFSIITLSGQDTIPNDSFENWATKYHPLKWETTNLLLPPGIVNCYRSPESFSGAYALHLESIDLDGMMVPGVATLGTIQYYNTTGGIPFTANPIALRGFYQHPSSGDEIMIGIEFFREGAAIGGGLWTTTDSVADYNEFYIPVSFYSDQSPDTVNITILTDPLKVGSSVLIDALEFVYEITSIPGLDDGLSKFLCYPNPSNGFITIETHSPQNVLVIYNMNGLTVKEMVLTDGKMTVDLFELPAGFYILEYRVNQNVEFDKLIIQ